MGAMAVQYFTSSYNEHGVHRLLNYQASELTWVDLFEPTADEIKSVEKIFAIELPTWEEMREIESTSRLYTENDCRFMTAPIMVRTDTDMPTAAEITFILTPCSLITIRRSEPIPFKNVIKNLQKKSPIHYHAVFFGLMEGIVDRQADFLEKIGRENDELSHLIFTPEPLIQHGESKFQDIICQLGRNGELIAREQECIVSLLRLMQYAGQGDFEEGQFPPDRKLFYPRAKPVMKDLKSLSEYSVFLSNKVNFMLDATLGLINIQQNAIVKIFSVAAVIFLPPTLVASIYGMNFKYMPELENDLGYPFALLLMVLSVVFPFLFCRKKGWL